MNSTFGSVVPYAMFFVIMGEGCGEVVISLAAKFRGWTFEPLPYWCKIGLFGEREGSSLAHKAEEVCLSSAKTGSPATISSWRLCQHWQCCFYHPYFSLSLYTTSKRSLFEVFDNFLVLLLFLRFLKELYTVLTYKTRDYLIDNAKKMLYHGYHPSIRHPSW